MPFELVGDMGDARRVYVVPSCLDGWPSGAQIDITVDAGLPDGFGQPLAAAASRKLHDLAHRRRHRSTVVAVRSTRRSNDAATNDAGTNDAAPDDAALDGTGGDDAADASDDQSN